MKKYQSYLTYLEKEKTQYFVNCLIFKTGFTHFIALFIFGFLEQICVHVA